MGELSEYWNDITIDRIFKNAVERTLELACKTKMQRIDETYEEYKKRLISEV